MKMLLWVQHLLGTGHVRRAAALAEALVAEGASVLVASGGMPVPGIGFPGCHMIPLPPVRVSDATFSRYLDAGGREAGEELWRERRSRLLRAEAEFRPDVILTETWPLGRRRFRSELEPLLDQAAARHLRPVVAASVRDILVTKDDGAKQRAMAADARRRLDMVLVHGSPDLVPLDATFEPVEEIRPLLRYTGYVAPERPPAAVEGPGAGEILVSTGGGTVGLPLFRAALAARPWLDPGPDWRLLVGSGLPEEDFAGLLAEVPPGVIVERARPDFPDMLVRCSASISQAGYNTVLDLVRARCRTVLVPFASGAETEQTLRARLLAERGMAVVVEEAELDGPVLAAAVRRALDAPPPPALPLAADGAARAARLLLAAAAGRGAA